MRCGTKAAVPRGTSPLLHGTGWSEVSSTAVGRLFRPDHNGGGSVDILGRCQGGLVGRGGTCPDRVGSRDKKPANSTGLQPLKSRPQTRCEDVNRANGGIENELVESCALDSWCEFTKYAAEWKPAKR
jgi:hypothetical protein